MPASTFTPSFEVCAAALCKQEAVYGTDPTPVAGTDDLKIYQNPNPITEALEFISLGAHRDVISNISKDIIGRKLANVNIRTNLTGGTGAGTNVMPATAPATVGNSENGFLSQMALWNAAGADVTVNGTTDITLTPALKSHLYSISSVNDPATTYDTSPFYGAATIWAMTEGTTMKVRGVRGNIVLTGTSSTPPTVDFTGQGLYSAPIGSSTLANWSGGTEYSTVMRETTTTINNGGGAYTPVLQSMRFDLGNRVVAVADVAGGTGTNGLYQIMITERNPTLQLVLLMDEDTTANLVYADFYADKLAQTTHDVAILHDDGGASIAGNQIQFDFDEAQITQVSLGGSEGLRTLTVDYRLIDTDATPTVNAEWKITIT